MLIVPVIIPAQAIPLPFFSLRNAQQPKIMDSGPQIIVKIIVEIMPTTIEAIAKPLISLLFSTMVLADFNNCFSSSLSIIAFAVSINCFSSSVIKYHP